MTCFLLDEGNTDAQGALDAIVENLDDDSSPQDPNLIIDYFSASSAQWRQQNKGTSFVFFPCTTCHVQRTPDEEGDQIRTFIVESLVDRLKILLDENTIVVEEIQTGFFYQGVSGFNNGEIYLWLRNRNIDDEIACNIMMDMRASLLKEPIKVQLRERSHTIIFYGQGFRQL